LGHLHHGLLDVAQLIPKAIGPTWKRSIKRSRPYGKRGGAPLNNGSDPLRPIDAARNDNGLRSDSAADVRNQRRCIANRSIRE
jgi:hypothetical protein